MTRDERIISKIAEVLGHPPTRIPRESLAVTIWNTIKPMVMEPKVVECKHEVIEIIGKFLDSVHDCGRLQMQRSKLSEKNLYDRIVPHFVREFPEEETSKALRKAYLKGYGDSSRGTEKWEVDTANELIPDLKLLWEGQDRGTCQKCGGDKVVPTKIFPKHVERPIPVWEECPDCDGTGEERRSGDERRNRKDERRKLSTFRQFILDGTDEVYRLAGDQDNVAQRENRRTSFRRSLVDRRK